MQIDKGRLYDLVGEKLRQRRFELKLTQKQVARDAGLLRTSLVNIEAGRQHAPLHVLYSLSATLGVEIASLLPSLEALNSPRTVHFEAQGISGEYSPDIAALLQEILGRGEEV